jgi:uncharacterized membrane protein
MNFDGFVLARVIHVLGVVLWIGGVAMVTTVLLPAVRQFAQAEQRVALFEAIEGRFARQARISTLLTGLSGFYMLFYLDGWQRLQQPEHWWLHAMLAVWLLFTLMLFVFEPLFLHRWFQQRAKTEPETTFRLIQRMHWLLLSVSLLAIAGAVAGSHGWLLGH